MPVVLDAADRAHLLKDGFRGGESVPEFLLRIPHLSYVRSKYQRHKADEHPSVLGGLGTYSQAVLAQGPFLHHEGLLLLVTHPVVELRFHGIQIEPEGLAGEEPAGERRLPDRVSVHFEGAQLATLPEGNPHEVVLLAERVAVLLRDRLAGLHHGLQDFLLARNRHLYPCQVVGPLVDVVVEVELQAVGLDDVVPVALHLIVEVVLLVEQPRLLREDHPLRNAGGQVYRLDRLERLSLAALDARYQLLTLGDAKLEILQGLVTAVGDEDDVPEPGVLQFGHDHVQRPRVRFVARKLEIVDRQMRRKRIHDDLQRLLQRQVLLVVAPADVHQMEPVGGHGRGVHGAVFVPAHPLRPESEQVHPVLLGDALGEARDAGAGERVHRRRLHLALPLLDMGIRTVVQEKVVCKRKHVLGLLKIAAEHLLQVAEQPGLPRHVVQEPRGPVHAVKVASLVLHRPAMPRTGQDLDLRQVPLRREDEAAPLLQGRVEVRRVGVEAAVIVDRPPVLVGVTALTVLTGRVWVRHGIHPSVVLMNADLVYRVRLCGPAFRHGVIVLFNCPNIQLNIDICNTPRVNFQAFGN